MTERYDVAKRMLSAYGPFAENVGSKVTFIPRCTSVSPIMVRALIIVGAFSTAIKT